MSVKNVNSSYLLVLPGTSIFGNRPYHGEQEIVPNFSYYVRLKVLTVACTKMTVFWDMAPCSLIEVDRRFRLTYFGLPGDESGTHL
jgi:hypothetical protein